jgi:hypothetical protein
MTTATVNLTDTATASTTAPADTPPKPPNLVVRRGSARRLIITHGGQPFGNGLPSNTKLFTVTLEFKDQGPNGKVFLSDEDAPYELTVRGKPRSYGNSRSNVARRLKRGNKEHLRVIDQQPGSDSWLIDLGDSGSLLEVKVEGDTLKATINS